VRDSPYCVTNYLSFAFLLRPKEDDQWAKTELDVLVEGGKKVPHPAFARRSSLTMAQLEGRGRASNGFESLYEVDQCVIEPGGTLLCGKRRRPPKTFDTGMVLPSWNASRRK